MLHARRNLSSRPGPPAGEPRPVLVSWLGLGVASGPPWLPVYHLALGSSRPDAQFLQSNSNGRRGPSGRPQAGAGRWGPLLAWILGERPPLVTVAPVVNRPLVHLVARPIGAVLPRCGCHP